MPRTGARAAARAVAVRGLRPRRRRRGRQRASRGRRPPRSPSWPREGGCGAARFGCGRPARRIWGLGLLAAFAVWNAVTLAWSVDPDGTWLEFNRSCLYVLALGIGIACGASWARAAEMLAVGLLLIASLVAIYALGQKLLPGLHVGGVFDLNQTGAAAAAAAAAGLLERARAAAGARGTGRRCCWRADPASCARLRGRVVALQLMLLTIAFTYSRGGRDGTGRGARAARSASAGRALRGADVAGDRGARRCCRRSCSGSRATA